MLYYSPEESAGESGGFQIQTRTQHAVAADALRFAPCAADAHIIPYLLLALFPVWYLCRNPSTVLSTLLRAGPALVERSFD